MYQSEEEGIIRFRFVSQVELPAPGEPNRDRVNSRRLNREIMERVFAINEGELLHQRPAYDGRKTLICAKKFFDEHYFVVGKTQHEGNLRIRWFCECSNNWMSKF